MNIPTTETITLTQAQRFVKGLKLIAKECHLTQVSYNVYGIVKYTFNDGSQVGNARAAIDAGFLDEKEFTEKYL